MSKSILIIPGVVASAWLSLAPQIRSGPLGERNERADEPKWPIMVSEQLVVFRRLPDHTKWNSRKQAYPDTMLKFRFADKSETVFAPGRSFGVRGFSQDKKSVLLEFENPRQVAILRAAAQTIRIMETPAKNETFQHLLLTRNDRFLIGGARFPGGMIYRWDLDFDQFNSIRVRPSSDHMCLSPDERLLAVMDRQAIDIVDIAMFRVISSKSYWDRHLVSIQFAPDGKSYSIRDQENKITTFDTPAVER